MPVLLYKLQLLLKHGARHVLLPATYGEWSANDEVQKMVRLIKPDPWQGNPVTSCSLFQCRFLSLSEIISAVNQSLDGIRGSVGLVRCVLSGKVNPQ